MNLLGPDSCTSYYFHAVMLIMPLVSIQEKTIALKIFELGLKKFGDIPEYIRAYVDFMSHLNGKGHVLEKYCYRVV